MELLQLRKCLGLLIVLSQCKLVLVCYSSKSAAYTVRSLSRIKTHELNKTVTVSTGDALVEPLSMQRRSKEKLERISRELILLHSWNQEREDAGKYYLNLEIEWMDKLINRTLDFLDHFEFPSPDDEMFMDIAMDETESALKDFSDRLPSNVQLKELKGYSPRWAKHSLKYWPNRFGSWGRYFFMCFEWQHNGTSFIDCRLHKRLSGHPDVPLSKPDCPVRFIRLPSGGCRSMIKSEPTNDSDYETEE